MFDQPFFLSIEFLQLTKYRVFQSHFTGTKTLGISAIPFDQTIAEILKIFFPVK